MKKIYIINLMFLNVFLLQAQAFLSNNGSLVSIKDQAMLSVQGDVFIENNGVFDNSDTIYFTNDWINNADNIGFSSSGEGYVYMIGEDQRIRGLDETHFHNLLLRTGGTKFGDLDVYVNGFLDLAFLEFNLDVNVVYVTSPEVDATINTTGFVSSLEEGGISRATNRNETYLFPVGSTIFDTIYRPIEMTPTENPQEFRVRFADADASNDGYDRDERGLRICDINENYYHRIWQDLGNDSVNITFNYIAAVDGSQWNDIVHWQGQPPQWEITPADNQTLGNPFDRLDVLGWGNFETPNFALAFTKEAFAFAGNDTTIFLNDTLQLMASGGDFYSWEPTDPLLGCAECPNPVFWDDTTRTLWVVVEDFDNCKDIDSITITIDDRFSSEGPFIPSGITPNGDGVNDYWNIRWLYKYPENDVTILNRWGDVVYKASPYNNDWYGTYNGKQLPEATYYYILKIFENGQQTQNYTGPITIID
jgi:gliding motility-associated-like protein